MNKYEAARQIYIKNNTLHIFDKAFDNLIDLIQRQTDYDYNTTKEKLIKHDLNTLSVIREYMGVKETRSTKNRSTNQMVFDEFRHFLTQASLEYEAKKEQNVKIKEMAYKELERRKKLGIINESDNENDNTNETIVL